MVIGSLRLRTSWAMSRWPGILQAAAVPRPPLTVGISLSCDKWAKAAATAE
jgi:hypothetical protein